jgi:hypothetical protein
MQQLITAFEEDDSPTPLVENDNGLAPAPVSYDIDRDRTQDLPAIQIDSHADNTSSIERERRRLMESNSNNQTPPETKKMPLQMDRELGLVFYAAITVRDKAERDLKDSLGQIRPDKRRKGLLRVRKQSCKWKCAACPHPRFQAITNNKAQALRGTSTELRLLGYHRDIQEITKAAHILYQSNRVARQTAALCKHVSQKSYDIYKDIQCFINDHNWQTKEPVYYPPDPFGDAFQMPFSTLVFVIDRFNDLLKAFQQYVYEYCSEKCLTKYHKTKSGSLGIALKHLRRNPLIPGIPVWRIYFRGPDGEWFSSHQAIFRNPQFGAKPTKVAIKNTPWLLARTGNRRHLYFYQAAQRLLREILAIRERLIALSKRLTSVASEIIKCHHK